MINLYNGDCLEVMDKLIEQGVKVDAIITDPPYGTTACSWDSVIPFNNFIKEKKGKKEIVWYEKEWIERELETTYKSIHQCRYEFKNKSKDGMWLRLNQLIKPNGAIVLFGNEPFTSALITSNLNGFKYRWDWNKKIPSGMSYSKYRPMQQTEDISVFTKNGEKTIYYPQRVKRDKPIKSGGISSSDSAMTKGYKPLNKTYEYKNPVTLLEFDKIRKGRLHPTQKPVALMEYLIKTYTNENETVLDFTMGSFTTAIACLNTKRDFIGIELDDNYFKVGTERVEKHLETLGYKPKIVYEYNFK